MSDRKPGRHRKTAAWAENPGNACAENGVTADGRSYHYSAAHNGYVFDEEPQASTEDNQPGDTIKESSETPQ